jgi:hypothetical protein
MLYMHGRRTKEPSYIATNCLPCTLKSHLQGQCTPLYWHQVYLFSLRAGTLSHFGIKASYTSNMRFLWNSYTHGVKHNITSSNITISRKMSVTLRLYTNFSIKIRSRTYVNKDSFQHEWALQHIKWNISSQGRKVTIIIFSVRWFHSLAT